MTPEDWKTYWRTCHLTPFQALDLEKKAERDRIKARLQARQDAFQREIDKIMTEKATELTDRLFLSSMGVKP